MEHLLSVNSSRVSDIPRLLGEGVDACSGLETRELRFRCASGIYAVAQDWIFPQPALHALIPLDDPYQLCQTASHDWAREACAWVFSKYVVRSFAFDAKKALVLQQDVGFHLDGGAHLPIMVYSTSFFVGERESNQPDRELSAVCSVLRSYNLRARCVRGIAEGLFFNGVPGGEALRAARFCISSGLTDRERLSCGLAVVKNASDTGGVREVERACRILANTPSAGYACGLSNI